MSYDQLFVFKELWRRKLSKWIFNKNINNNILVRLICKILRVNLNTKLNISMDRGSESESKINGIKFNYRR